MKMKEVFERECAKEGFIKMELTTERTNETYLRHKIIEFGQNMMVHCEKGVGKEKSNVKLDLLFKTYLILQGVSMGSFLNFAEKHLKGEFIRLSSQRFLRDEKHLGYRYLKSKIAVILSQA